MTRRLNSTYVSDWKLMSIKQRGDFAGRRERFRQYDSPATVTAYLERLKREWPERVTIADHICTLITTYANDHNRNAPVVLELCCGPGWLAMTLLEKLPIITYTGLDLSPPFLAFAQERLTPYGNRATLFEADLSTMDWPECLPGNEMISHFDAIVSLQSLHDVGDERVIGQIYTIGRSLLRPGGFLLNADLVVAEGEELSNNPGRLSIPRHLTLLKRIGYGNVRCTLAVGGFGLIVGENRVNTTEGEQQ